LHISSYLTSAAAATGVWKVKQVQLWHVQSAMMHCFEVCCPLKNSAADMSENRIDQHSAASGLMAHEHTYLIALPLLIHT
jgi:hypothetical protein